MKEIRELHGEGVFSWGEVHTGCGLSLSVVDMLFIGGNYSALFDAFTVNDKMVMATVRVVFTRRSYLRTLESKLNRHG